MNSEPVGVPRQPGDDFWESGVYDDGYLRLESDTYFLKCGGQFVHLRRQGFLLFARLLRTPERVVTIDELMAACAVKREKRGSTEEEQWVKERVSMNCIRVELCRVRRVLAPYNIKIENLRNVGYRLFITRLANATLCHYSGPPLLFGAAASPPLPPLPPPPTAPICFNCAQTDFDYEDGKLKVDFAGMRINCNGRELKLTRKEWGLLKTLMESAGQVMSPQKLIRRVWGSGYKGDPVTLRVHVLCLRRKLDGCGDYIETLIGLGYRFRPLV